MLVQVLCGTCNLVAAWDVGPGTCSGIHPQKNSADVGWCWLDPGTFVEKCFTWQPKHPQTIKSNPDINLQFLGCSLWCQFGSARFRWGAGFSLLHYWVVYGQPFWVCQRWSEYSGICPFERSNSATEMIVAWYVWKTDLGTCQIAISQFRIIMSFKSIVEIWHGLWIVQDIWEDCACAMFWNVLFFLLWIVHAVARKHRRCFRRRNCWHPTSNS